MLGSAFAASLGNLEQWAVVFGSGGVEGLIQGRHDKLPLEDDKVLTKCAA